MANLAHTSRYALLLILVAAYSLAAHFASVSVDVGRMTMLFALGPFLGLLIFRTWASRYRYVVLVGSTFVSLLLLTNWSAASSHLSWIYFAQHFGINAMLCLVFGRSLLRDREPICTRMAALVEEQLTPSVVRYTRTVTLTWTVFFGIIAGVSAGLFIFASLMAWSMYANILYLPLVFLMFAAEFSVRLRVLRGTPHTRLIKTMRCVWVQILDVTTRGVEAESCLSTPQSEK